MKKLTFLVLFLGLINVSFQDTNTIKNQSKGDLKHLEVKITGMTCEIGCARTIESKISKMEGVKYSKVIFAKSLGQFSYDPNVTNAKKIIQKINGIGGGNLYKVIDSKEVKGF